MENKEIPKRTSHFRRNWLWYTIIFLLTAGNIYFWSAKKWQAYRHKQELETVQIQFNQEKAIVVEQTRQEEIKRQAGLAGGILQEIIVSENWDQFEIISQNMIRNSHFTAIVFTDKNDKVQAASNSEFKNKKREELINQALLTSDESVHSLKTDLGYTLTVPAFDGNNYLGRIIFFHSLHGSNVPPL